MLIYDCEIKKAILGQWDKPVPRIQYCKGFNDFANMGISCVGVYDFDTSQTRIFMDDNQGDLLALFEAHDCIIGFNNHRFDDMLIEAAYGYEIPVDKSYDLLAEMYEAANVGQEWDSATHGGYSLGKVAAANFKGLAKSGSGANAPIWYQQNMLGRLVDYCLQDITITRMLVEKVLNTGKLMSPKKGVGELTIERPMGERLF